MSRRVVLIPVKVNGGNRLRGPGDYRERYQIWFAMMKIKSLHLSTEH